ncbi:MAG: flagellar hook-length control protein FliK [Lachnospiraceae bacterium]|nr:flagellar hook-length control protein FliK [Lachnospiraceae bacterium]
MGITPIMDATGLTDQLIPAAAPVKPSDNGGVDFRSVWNDQAGNRNANDLRPDSASDSFDRTGSGNDRKAGETAADRRTDSRNRDVRSAKPDEASKTDVKGTDSPEAAGRDEAKPASDTGNVLKDEEIVSAQETLAAIVSDLTAKLADILDMSPEELEGLLQAEGITGTDLLNVETFNSLVITALGAEDQISLITNEEDYAVFGDAVEAFDEVMASDSGCMEMTVSELKSAVDELAGGSPLDVTDSATDEMTAETAGESTDLRTADEADVVTRFVRNSEGELEQVGPYGNGGITGESKVVMKAKENGENGRDFGEHEGSENGAGLPGQDASMNAAPANEASAPEQPVSYVTNANDIADQILENMKTVTDGDFTDVEMQLHPASLGMVRVHVTSEAGVITANFITENEAVKAAVESQMIRLSEQFEAQGIRVEAVEVTIASHSFEGNLQSGENEARGENGSGAKRTRRIDLGDDGDLDTSSMEDEDRIAAEMMAANGNKVDYTA